MQLQNPPLFLYAHGRISLQKFKFHLKVWLGFLISFSCESEPQMKVSTLITCLDFSKYFFGEGPQCENTLRKIDQV